MVAINSLDAAKLNLLEPLVAEFVNTHQALSFREDYLAAFREWMQRLTAEPDKVFFVAEDDEEVVGFAVGVIEENGPLLFPDKIGYIPILVVAPEHRRQGTGGKLWGALNDWFSSRRVREVQLYTQIGNDASRNFWD